MTTVDITLGESVRKRFPAHAIGAWQFSLPDAELMRASALAMQAELLESDALRGQLEAQIERWKPIIKAAGGRSGEKSSIDNLWRSMLRNGSLREWHPFVTYYNALSLLTGTPMGAYDVDKLAGPIHLTDGPNELTFTPMTEPDKNERTRPDEVYYQDGARIICRVWNVGDCYETKVIETTKEVVLTADLIGDDVGINEVFARITDRLSRLPGTDGGRIVRG